MTAGGGVVRPEDGPDWAGCGPAGQAGLAGIVGLHAELPPGIMNWRLASSPTRWRVTRRGGPKRRCRNRPGVRMRSRRRGRAPDGRPQRGPANRAREQVLAERGYEPFRDEEGVIRLRNRPFHCLQAHWQTVCGMNLCCWGSRRPQGQAEGGPRSPPGLVLRSPRLDVRCDSPQADQRTVKPLESLMPSAAPQIRLLDRSAALRRFRRVSSARSVAVCIPARNEAATIGPIVRSVAGLVDCGRRMIWSSSMTVRPTGPRRSPRRPAPGWSPGTVAQGRVRRYDGP